MEKRYVIELLKKYGYNTAVCFDGKNDRYYKEVESYAKTVYVEFTDDGLFLCAEFGNNMTEQTKIRSGVFYYKNNTEDNLLWLLDKFEMY